MEDDGEGRESELRIKWKLIWFSEEGVENYGSVFFVLYWWEYKRKVQGSKGLKLKRIARGRLNIYANSKLGWLSYFLRGLIQKGT